MARVCLFIDNMALLLSHVVRNDEGTIKGGLVINGQWDLEIENGVLLAKAGDRIVTRTPLNGASLVEVPVPNTVSEDYNQAIEWAIDNKH